MDERIHNLFYDILKNDPVKVMVVPVDEIEVHIALNIPYKIELKLTNAQKIMLFQDRKLSAMCERNNNMSITRVENENKD